MTDSFKVRNAELQRPLLIKATPRDPELQNVTDLEDLSGKEMSKSNKLGAINGEKAGFSI